jgi:glyoxylase-like metal-dependent hydrolase (beta-lactamase superfamily II)
METFQIEKIADQITKIKDLGRVYAYLIEGSAQAALIDTGGGAGDLKGLVENLTNKPLDVILTHSHVDHSGGFYGFSSVYLYESDYALALQHTTVEFRRGFIESNVPAGTVP